MNKDIFARFEQKARQKLQDKIGKKTKVLHVGALDEDITIHGLTQEEVSEAREYSENEIEQDKYLVYQSSKELQELGVKLKQEGVIKKETDVVDIFSAADRREIAMKIFDLSGMLDDTTVSEVEEIKNS